MSKLTKHEELVLLAIWKLQGNAYGVTIRNHILEITGKSINYGSLCNTLYGLVHKEMINSKESNPSAVKGGRRKILYNLTIEGRKTLKGIYDEQKRAWEGVNPKSLEIEEK